MEKECSLAKVVLKNGCVPPSKWGWSRLNRTLVAWMRRGWWVPRSSLRTGFITRSGSQGLRKLLEK